MTVDAAVPTRNNNPFDDWRCIASAIFMALVGYTVMMAIPVLSTALVERGGFSDIEVGRIWGADMGGFAIGAALSALFVGRMNRRHLVWIGVALCIICNALCLVFLDYEALLFLRLGAGVASGIFTGIAVATMGGATNPVNVFNIEILAFAVSTPLTLQFLPSLSMEGIYILFVIIALMCAFLVQFLPTRPLNEEELAQQELATENVVNWNAPLILTFACLMAMCFTYINIGGYYTYIELAALDDGLEQSWLTPVLSAASFFGGVGCLLAYLSYRFGLFKPLIYSLIAMAASVIMVSTGITSMTFAISIFAFMTIWTYADIFQCGMLAHMDRTGTYVAMIPAVQGLGNFLGPNIAATVLDADLGYGTMFTVSGSMTIVAIVLYIVVRVAMRKRLPAVA